MLLHADLSMITTALNEQWEDKSQWYEVYIDCNGVFHWYLSYSVAYSLAGVGETLRHKSQKLVEYSYTQFPDLWREYLTGKK